MFTHHIQTSVVIDAPVGVVWDVLMAFEQYPSWNPFIIQIEGSPAVGEKLRVCIRPDGHTKANRFTPKVISNTARKEFAWVGSVPLFLFKGVHKFVLVELSERQTELHHTEAFSGLLVPLMGGILRATANGFHRMNTALKARAEEFTAPA